MHDYEQEDHYSKLNLRSHAVGPIDQPPQPEDLRYFVRPGLLPSGTLPDDPNLHGDRWSYRPKSHVNVYLNPVDTPAGGLLLLRFAPHAQGIETALGLMGLAGKTCEYLGDITEFR